MKFSIIIVVKNEGHILGKTLSAIAPYSDDIIVADTGSTDDTVAIAKYNGAKVIELPWQGFGPTKNKANTYAQYDWICSLDADEIPDTLLLQGMLEAPPTPDTIYRCKTLNYLVDRPIKHSGWYPNYRYRLFPKVLQWDDNLVHEKVVVPPQFYIRTLPGHLHHYSSENLADYQQKQLKYARLKAQRLFDSGRQPSIWKRYFGASIKFLLVFLWKGGWRGGREGRYIAITEAQMVRAMIQHFDTLTHG